MSTLARLVQFIEAAPAGTMVLVESLREFILAATDPPAEADMGLSPSEAADWLHRHLGGRKRTPAAVRKVMRTGFRGVVLDSYPYGRERRTTVNALRKFISEIGAEPRSPAGASARSEALLETTSSDAGSSRFDMESNPDPADEIAAAQARFGGVTGQRPGRRALG